jgi:hypothetical protein
MDQELKEITYYNKYEKRNITISYPDECLEILRKERRDDWRIEYEFLENGLGWCKHIHPFIMELIHVYPELYKKLNIMLDQLEGPYSKFKEDWSRNREERLKQEAIEQEKYNKLMQEYQEKQKQKQEELIRKRKEQMGSRYNQYYQIKLDIFKLSNEMQEISSQICVCEERITEKRPKLEEEEKKKKNNNKTYNKKKHEDAIAFIEKYNQKLNNLIDTLTSKNQILIQLKNKYEELKKEHDEITVK